ncbi:hypothetical protein HYH02_003251 [Chlamydomonas schloesseri]|uniref:WRKY domain-containing protein n=1 Tax=Chlamydomonas schloesseri TaxID=2026947 RepID=A0A835WSX8_9CHLO|nr:hypothetical protein HYH02_003251 [Chlamydomonas schloesseri]|eukprot:KAG2452221.1 hypothetical protein HYH02_003251 [Chlamydomonas schloesseri]
MDSSIPFPRPINARGPAPGQTPSQLSSLPPSLQARLGLGATHDSPVLLPLLQVEASPTTGIHQLCPPLFQPAQPGRVPLPIPARTEAASAAPEPARAVKREYEPRAGNGKQSVANSDGWQWRKYGEKLVKGSPNPRSYYKCSHPGCLAKKIVERSDSEGTVLSTEYKGDHCHPAPSAVKASRFKPKPKAEPPAMAPPPAVGPVDASLPVGFPPGANGRAGLHLSGGDMLPIPEALKSDFPVPHPAGGAVAHEDDTDTSEPEPAAALKAAPQDSRAAQAAATAIRKVRDSAESPSKRLDMLAAYAEEAERQLKSNSNSPEQGPSAKRQRTEAGAVRTRANPEEDDEGSGAPSTSGMQRVVDITNMDDGYRWRKYGQKQVKGSPFPRAYYKCTHMGCSVRKHVERSAEDETRFVVTYEGTHNHRPPTGSRRRNAKDVAEDDEDYEGEDAEEDSSQPTSPQYGHVTGSGGSGQQAASKAAAQGAPLHPSGAQPASADFGQQLQQLSTSLLASTVLQQAALSGVLPLIQYNSLSSEALASLGVNSEALQGVEQLNPLNLNLTSGNLADLTNLLRQHAQLDLALAAQAQAIDQANASWDPLACLITPRPNVSPPGQGPAAGQAAPSAGTGRQTKAAVFPKQVATTEA